MEPQNLQGDHPPLLLLEPTRFMPIIHVLKDYLPWKATRELQQTNTSWIVALREVFFRKSEFCIEIETPLKRTLVNRDSLDNSPFFRAYKYPTELLRKKIRDRINTLEELFPVVLSEESALHRVTSLTIHATILEECEEIDRLLKWLKFYGAKVTKLTLYKPVIEVVHEPTLGSTNMMIRKKTFDKFLQCFPSLNELQITGSKLHDKPLESFTVTIVEDDELFEEVQELFQNTPGTPDNTEFMNSRTQRNVKTLRIREMFRSEGSIEVIELFPYLEKLTFEFILYADPSDRIHSLRTSRTCNLNNLKELEIIFRDQENSFDRHTLFELSMIDFTNLKCFKINRISVESDMNDSGILHLITFLEKVKNTLEHLEITFENVRWYMGVRGRRFLEILSERIPIMLKLQYLRIESVSEGTHQPFLQVVQRLPALQKISLSHKFEMINQNHLNFLPDEIFVCKSLRSFKIHSMDFVLDRHFFHRLPDFFPDLECLDVSIDCGAHASLFSYLRLIRKWPELKSLRLRCKNLFTEDFNRSLSMLSYIGLDSMAIENESKYRVVEISLQSMRSGFRRMPHLKLLELKGFKELETEAKRELFRTLGERNPQLSIALS